MASWFSWQFPHSHLKEEVEAPDRKAYHQTSVSGSFTSEKDGWIKDITPSFEQWFFERFGISVHVELIVTGNHDSVNLILQESSQPTAWSPASSIWIPYLNQKWIGLKRRDKK